MVSLELDSSRPEFRYKIGFSRQDAHWVIDSVQVMHQGTPLLPRRPVRGTFATEQEMIERAVKWCDTVVHHLLHYEVSVPELITESIIKIDQLDGGAIEQSNSSLRRQK